MRLQNKITGDVLEIPPPDAEGRSVVLVNGRIVERVVYDDADGGTTTTQDGRVYRGGQWAQYLIEQLRIGAWRIIN